MLSSLDYPASSSSSFNGVSVLSASFPDQFNTSTKSLLHFTQVKHKQQWRTNAPATPSPSFKPPTGISSPGAAQTATPVPSWLSGGARSVATVAATRATPQRHENGILPGPIRSPNQIDE